MKIFVPLLALFVISASSSLSDYLNSHARVSRTLTSDLLRIENIGSSTSTHLHKPYISKDFFRGTEDSSGVSIISAALETSFSDDCIPLFQVLVDRPDWFTFHRHEVGEMRKCLTNLVNHFDGNHRDPIISQFIYSCIDALYDPGLEIVMRQTTREFSYPKNPSLLFRGYLENLIHSEKRSRMISVLLESSVESITVESLVHHERWYFDKLVSGGFSSPWILHFPEFLTSVVGRLMSVSRENEALGLFKLIIDKIPQYDHMDHDLATRRLLGYQAPGEFTFDRSSFHKTNKVSSFFDFPGNFLLQIWTRNVYDDGAIAAIDACMPKKFARKNSIEREDWDGMVSNIRQLFEFVSEKRELIDMYRCLVHIVIEGKISLPDDRADFERATVSVFFMMMLTHSTDIVMSTI